MSCPEPSFTVAVPTCNGEVHLAETLGSILAQEGCPFELLVCDDRSDDGTVELVRRAAGGRARVLVNERRLGLAGNWNRCAAECRTPYIAIVHQDDLLCPGHLAAHLDAFEGGTRVGLVASASTVIDDAGRDVPERIVERGGLGGTDHVFPPGAALEGMALGNPLRCSAVSIRIEAHRASGGFDPALRYVLDWDFWLRTSRRWSLAWLASPTVKVRWHLASETHRFRTGTTDLEESRLLVDRLFREDLEGRPGALALHQRAYRRLARAFLNRAHDALQAGQVERARQCLAEARRLSPRIVLEILRDPRLAASMALVRFAPRLAERWSSGPG